MNLKPILLKFLNWRDNVQVDTKAGHALTWEDNEALVDAYLEELKPYSRSQEKGKKR